MAEPLLLRPRYHDHPRPWLPRRGDWVVCTQYGAYESGFKDAQRPTVVEGPAVECRKAYYQNTHNGLAGGSAIPEDFVYLEAYGHGYYMIGRFRPATEAEEALARLGGSG